MNTGVLEQETVNIPMLDEVNIVTGGESLAQSSRSITVALTFLWDASP